MRPNWRFYIGILALLIFLLPVNYYAIMVVFEETFNAWFYFSYIYYILLISMVQVVVNRSLLKRPQQFVNTFMAVMGVKIFLSLIILVVCLYIGPENKKVFGVNFLLLYLIFSGFSIYHIMRAQREISSK